MNQARTGKVADGQYAQQDGYRVIHWNTGGYAGYEWVDGFGWVVCDIDFPDALWNILVRRLQEPVVLEREVTCPYDNPPYPLDTGDGEYKTWIDDRR